MRPRSDGLYGNDDPLQWPQPYVEQLPHLPCIRQPVSDISSPYFELYQPLQSEDFVPWEPRLCDGVGRFHKDTFKRLQIAVDFVLQRVVDHKAWFNDGGLEKNKTNTSRFINPYKFALEATLTRLQTNPLTWNHMYFNLREVQRFTLEIDAMIQLAEVYNPRLSGHTSPKSTQCDPVMGCFSVNVEHTAAMAHACIPVWTIHPYRALENQIMVRRVMNMKQPTDIVLDDSRPEPWDTVYVGPSGCIDKYKTMYRFSRNLNAYTNIFQHPVWRSSTKAPKIGEISPLGHEAIENAPSSGPSRHDKEPKSKKKPCEFLIYLFIAD